MCEPRVAERHSGYKVGGTSPFGTRHAMPIYVERSVLALDRIYVNGGARGFLVGLQPRGSRRRAGADAGRRLDRDDDRQVLSRTLKPPSQSAAR